MTASEHRPRTIWLANDETGKVLADVASDDLTPIADPEPAPDPEGLEDE